jgi:hypothetical protein
VADVYNLMRGKDATNENLYDFKPAVNASCFDTFVYKKLLEWQKLVVRWIYSAN